MRTVPWLVAAVAVFVAHRARTLAADAAMLESRLAAQIRETNRAETEARQFFFLWRELVNTAPPSPPVTPAGDLFAA